jgi:AcrR family transcriptional regulator
MLRDEVLAGARELFLSQGFAATSVQQIADRVGATQRTLYVKVGSKETLFRAVITDVLSEWRRSVDADIPGESLPSRLEQIGLHLLSVVLAPDMVRLNRVLLSEAYRSPSLVEELAEQVEQGPVPQLVRLLMEVRGANQPSRQDQIAARLFYEMVTGAPLRVALTGRPPSVQISHDDWVRAAVRTFLLGWQDSEA